MREHQYSAVFARIVREAQQPVLCIFFGEIGIETMLFASLDVCIETLPAPQPAQAAVAHTHGAKIFCRPLFPPYISFPRYRIYSSHLVI